MEENVRLSPYCEFITSLIIIVSGVGIWLTSDTLPVSLTIAALVVAMLLAAMFYAPRRLAVTDTKIIVKSYLRSHKILLRNVESVTLYSPTMGSKRIFGGGGFLGYWGYFSEGDTGHYIAYYGRASDCFLIRMTNGDKYVLGCENASEVADYIKSLIS